MSANPHNSPPASVGLGALLPLYLFAAAGFGYMLFTYDKAPESSRIEIAALEKKHADEIKRNTEEVNELKRKLDDLSKTVGFLEEERSIAKKHNSIPTTKAVNYTVVRYAPPPGNNGIAIDDTYRPVHASISKGKDNYYNLEFRRPPNPIPVATSLATIEIGAEQSIIAVVGDGFLRFNDKDDKGNPIPSFPKIANEGVMIGKHIWWNNGEHWIAQ